MIFQILLVAFALFVIARTWLQFKQRRVSVYWFIVWVLMWVVVLVVAITPQTTDALARFVGVGRGADLIVYTAVVLLFYLLYRVMIRQETLRREITDVVRQIAILEAKKNDVKKD